MALVLQHSKAITNCEQSQAASFRIGRISTSAEIPKRSCKRRIMPIDKSRLRFNISATRARVRAFPPSRASLVPAAPFGI